MYNTSTRFSVMGGKVLIVAGLLSFLITNISNAQDLLPLKGKWNTGDAADYIGIWKKSQRIGYLDGTGNGDINGVTAAQGNTGDIPLTLDFTGDEREELALYRPSTRELIFYADYSSSTPTYVRTVGDPGDIVITGDWDGNGKDGFATYKPGSRSIWYFQDYNSSQPLSSIITGNSGDIPITGDWDGDGADSYALYRPATREIWFCAHYDDTTPYQRIEIGNPGDQIITGDWDGNGADGAGVFRRTSGTTSNYEFWLYDAIDGAPTRSIFLTDQSNFTFAVSGGRKVFYTQNVPHTDFDGNRITTYNPTTSFVPKGIYGPRPEDLIPVYQGNYNLALMWPSYYPLDHIATGALDETSNKLRTILYFETPGGKPFTGRFTGGRDLPGISSDGSRLLYFDSNGDGAPDLAHRIGDSGDYMFSGDWDGDGTDEFAGYKPGTRQIVYFQNIMNPQAVTTITIGNPGDVPLAGNWDGVGGDGYALYRPETRQIIYFQGHTDTTPFAAITVGDPGDMIIAGDWDGDGRDSYAIYRPSTRQFIFFQHYNDTTPFLVQQVGNPGDLPVAGDWDGDGVDGFGAYRTDSYRTRHELWFYNTVSSGSAGLTSAIFKNPLLETPKKYVYGIYTDDEPTGRNENWQQSYDNLTNVYAAYANLSPHVFFHVDISYVTTTDYNTWWRRFAKLGEATAHDDYPVSNLTNNAQNASQVNTVSHVATTVENARLETNESLPNWYVSQAFQQDEGGTFRFYKPSAAQHRAMVYTALVHGATGIFSFMHYNSLFPSIDGMSPTRNTDLWTAATQINSELDDLKPYLLSPTAAASYYIYTKASPQYEVSPIRCVLKYFDGSYVLIAVNMTSQSFTNAIIQLPVNLVPASGLVSRMFEGTTLRIKAGGINDTFSAFGVHVYKFSAPAGFSAGRGALATPEVTAAQTAAVPLVDVYPNPATHAVSFTINATTAAAITIQINNFNGKSIRTLTSNASTQEKTSLTWDRIDQNQNKAPEGLYYYTVYADGKVLHRGKLVIK